MYNPNNCYWSGPLGVYSSARRSLVATNDENYLAFGAPWPWPTDATGAQTAAALDEVLVRSGLPPTGLAAPTQAQLQAYAGNTVATLLSTMRTYTADGATLKADGTDGTIARLLALASWGQSNPTATENWIANDWSSTPITGAQFVALSPLVGAYAQLIYGTELNTVLAQITAGTITTTAQIAAFAWTV